MGPFFHTNHGLPFEVRILDHNNSNISSAWNYFKTCNGPFETARRAKSAPPPTPCFPHIRKGQHCRKNQLLADWSIGLRHCLMIKSLVAHRCISTGSNPTQTNVRPSHSCIPKQECPCHWPVQGKVVFHWGVRRSLCMTSVCHFDVIFN